MKHNYAFELVGYADPSGMNLGFLVPVFRAAHTNAPLVQRFGAHGEIASFEPYEAPEAKLVNAPHRTRYRGDAGIHAFASGTGQPLTIEDESGRKELARLIEHKLLAERPLLAVEAAAFLGRRDLRDKAARRVYEQFRTTSTDVADHWRDLSILSSDIRLELERAFGPRVARSLQAIVARVYGDIVELIGARQVDRLDWRGKLRVACEAAFANLPKLYPQPQNGWRYRFVRSERHIYDMKAEAAVLIASSDSHELAEGIAASPVLELDVSFEDGLHFTRIVEETRLPLFVVYDAKSPDQMLRASGDWTVRAMHGLALGSPERRRRDEAHEQDGRWRATFISSAGIRTASQDPRGYVAGVQLAIAAELDRQNADLSWDVHAALLLKARGLGPQPETDAIASMYDRAWSLGLSPSSSLTLIRSGGRMPALSEFDLGWAAAALLDRPEYLRGPFLNRIFDTYRTTAALLVDASPRRPEDDARHWAALIRVLESQRWDIADGDLRSDDGILINGPRARLRLRAGKPVRAHRLSDTRTLMDMELSSVGRVVVTGDATSGSVIAQLMASGDLAVNVRDLMNFNASRATILTLVAAQLKRLVTGLPSRSRSLFLAMLVNNAYRSGNIDLRNPAQIMDLAMSSELGEEVHFVVRSTAVLDDVVTAEVRVMPGYHSAPRPQNRFNFTITISDERISVGEKR